MLEPTPLSARWCCEVIWSASFCFSAELASRGTAACSTTKRGTGRTSGSLRMLLSSVRFAIASSTLCSRSTARRSPAPRRRSSNALGHVTERQGKDGILTSLKKGLKRSEFLVGGVWKVEPLRRDTDRSESERSSTVEQAGLRRGCKWEEDMLKKVAVLNGGF